MIFYSDILSELLTCCLLRYCQGQNENK